MFSFKSSHRRCSVKKLFLKISQISQENTCVRNAAGLQFCNFVKKRLQQWCFPVKFAELLRTPILKNIFERLLLQFLSHGSCSLLNVINLSTKNKIQRRGFIFFKKSEIKSVGNRKKNFFSANLFQKILIFHISVSSGIAQCFVGAFR